MDELLRRVSEGYTAIPWVLRVAIILAIAVVTTAGGIWVLLRLPVDHFQPGPHTRLPVRNPVARIALLIAKNLLGIVVLPLGIIMSVPLVPGPGLVFVILGLSLLDFPGKRALERRIVRRPFVQRVLNQTRARFGRPPFVIDDAEEVKSEVKQA